MSPPRVKDLFAEMARQAVDTVWINVYPDRGKAYPSRLDAILGYIQEPGRALYRIKVTLK